MNRRIFFIIAVALAGASAISCSKEQPSGADCPVRIDVGAAPVKTVLNGKTVLWQSGDAVSVFDGESNKRFTTSDSGSQAQFTGSAAPSASYTVIYPYDAGSSLQDGKISFSWPSVQAPSIGTFASGANISAGLTSSMGGSHSVIMYNAGCVVRFSVRRASSGVTRVDVRTAGGEKISGSSLISFSSEGIPAATASGSDCVSAVPASGASCLEGGEYVLCLCPVFLSEGFVVDVYRNDEKTASWSFDGLSEFKRNASYVLKGFVDDGLSGLYCEGMGDEHPLSRVDDESKLNDWNRWNSRESLLANFNRAADEGKTYFSRFKFYNYEKTNTITGTGTVSATYGFPLIYGLDFYTATGVYFPESQRKKHRANLLGIVKEAWERNHSIPSFSWHLESPYANYDDFCTRQGQGMGCRFVYGESWCDNFPGKDYRYQVRDILANREVNVDISDGKGGTYNVHLKLGDWFDERLREVADMINEFVDGNGQHIPVILRLWHELEHMWAWWQVDYYKYTNCSREDYIAFWQLTVEKFRTYCPDAIIVFAYCTDRFFASSDSRYMNCYPGDDYVDIMGYDDYGIGQIDDYGFSEENTLAAIIDRARAVTAAALAHGKIAAIFETNNSYSSGTDEENAAQQRKFFSYYLQGVLNDPQVKLPLFQIWSGCDNTAAKKEAQIEFTKASNIIFSK